MMENLVSFISLSTLLLLVVARTTDNDSPAVIAYWNDVFPGTPMPNAIRSLLPFSTQVSGSDGGRGHLNEDQAAVLPVRPIARRAWVGRWGALGHGHDTSEVNGSPNLAPLYFLRKDLQPDSRMNVTLMISPVSDASNGAEPTFLPRQQARAVPFSSSNLTALLKMFSIEPQSDLASLTRQTLVDCETPALKGEVKFCATSLESMIDFVVAEFRSSKVHAVFTRSVVNRGEEVKARTYRVGFGGGKMYPEAVACHHMMFPCTVFYCHKFAGTRAYMVPLVADDGSRVDAIALCHFDTSSWNPGHASFRLLGVEPGTVPICHFIVKDLAWVPD